MKYDDASWHSGGDFPADLPSEAGATHTGMFLAWALLSGLGGSLHTEDFPEDVERLKATYSFSAKSLVRIIGQYVSTDRNVALYTFPITAHDGAFLGSILYSYKLNWQTVLFVGYGDDRVLTVNNDLAKLDRSLFFKISYALQR